MSEIECPYCDYLQEINHDDGYGYEQDKLHQQQCVKCNKNFAYTTEITFYYESFKADCLNDGNHDYKPTTTFPKWCTQMCCKTCDERREPTFEERKKYGLLPTDEDIKMYPSLTKYLTDKTD